MELIERDGFLAMLQTHFKNIEEGGGRCVLISGEAGIGKTSLINAFCAELKKEYKIYKGTCDALYTPRPLAPLYDIALQMRSDFMQEAGGIEDRAGLFTRFFHELNNQAKPGIIVFEDIHWADEATLDFINSWPGALRSCGVFLFLLFVMKRSMPATASGMCWAICLPIHSPASG